VTILPFLWTCCKGQLKAEITKRLPFVTEEGESCVEQSTMTFGVALQVITEVRHPENNEINDRSCLYTTGTLVIVVVSSHASA
jgi:hypothetical protein